MNPAAAQRLLACALLCAGLFGCAGAGNLDADAPSGVNLGGSWKLDRALSDDPEQIYAKIQRQRAARLAEQMGAPAPGTSPAPAAGGANPDGSGGDLNNPLTPAGQAALILGQSHLDPFDMGVFGNIPRGNVIRIKQTADEVSISDGLTDRSFTPGGKSVVSVPEGVADQHSGWKSHDFVIDARAEAGPRTIERYHLSSDGQHLLAEIQSNGGNLPSMKIKRVYDRLSVAPDMTPSTN